MPAKSKQQLKYIYAMQNKYGSKEDTPEKMKWIWDKDLTTVDYKSLPDTIERYSPFFE